MPGLREELVTALIRSRCPRRPAGTSSRRRTTPRAVLAEREPGRRRAARRRARPGAARPHRRRGRRRRTGTSTRVPAHLRVTFRVEDARRQGRRPRARTSRPLASAARAAAAAPAMPRRRAALERTGPAQWNLGERARDVRATSRRAQSRAYPALVDPATCRRPARAARPGPRRDAAHRARGAPAAAAQHHRALEAGPRPADATPRSSPSATTRTAACPALLDDCLACAVDAIVAERRAGGDGARRRRPSRRPWPPCAPTWRPGSCGSSRLVEPVLAKHLRGGPPAATRLTAPPARRLVADVRAQLRELVRPGFVADTGSGRLRRPRPLPAGDAHRLDKAPADLARDARAIERGRSASRGRLRRPARRRCAPRGGPSDDVVDIGWMVEELRVTLFAQTLGTAYPVSEKRVAQGDRGGRRG